MYQTFHEQRSRSGSHSRERDRHPGAFGVFFGDTTHSRGKATQVLQGPLGPEGMGSRMGSRDHLRPEGAVKETELFVGEAVRGTSVPRLPSRRENSRLLGLLIGPAGSIQKLESANMVGNAGSSMTRARATLRSLLRGPVIGPLGTSLCTSDIATTGCTPRTTAGPVVEDEEGETPRSPTPSPPDREARRLDSPAQGLTDF